MFCLHKDQLHEHRRTSSSTPSENAEASLAPCGQFPQTACNTFGWVTSAFFLLRGTNTCKYVGLFLIFPFDLKVLKTSTRHLTLYGRLPITAQNNTYFMCRRRRESVYSKINISTFIKHSTCSLFFFSMPVVAFYPYFYPHYKYIFLLISIPISRF